MLCDRLITIEWGDAMAYFHKVPMKNLNRILSLGLVTH